jgi:hypothetical protein
MATIKLKLESHREYGTSYEDVVLGRFSYVPASTAIKKIISILNDYNMAVIESEHQEKYSIKVKSSSTENYRGTITFSGPRKVVTAFINKLLADSDLLSHFDVQVK